MLLLKKIPDSIPWYFCLVENDSMKRMGSVCMCLLLSQEEVNCVSVPMCGTE